jgi:hypothetical protein
MLKACCLIRLLRCKERTFSQKIGFKSTDVTHLHGAIITANLCYKEQLRYISKSFTYFGKLTKKSVY